MGTVQGGSHVCFPLFGRLSHTFWGDGIEQQALALQVFSCLGVQISDHKTEGPSCDHIPRNRDRRKGLVAASP